MSPLFGCLFGLAFAFLAVILFMVSHIARKARDIMSMFSPRKGKSQSTSTGTEQQNARPHHSPSSTSGTHKIFDDNEGEYVDFEEIK